MARRAFPFATAVAFAVLVAPDARGQGSLTIVQGSSPVTLSGTVLGTTLQQQGTGSLTSTMTGTVGVSALDLVADQIGFGTAGTAVTPANTGNWAPLPGGASGTAPAQYGAKATVLVFVQVTAAIRGATFTIDGDPTAALTPGAGNTYTFPATQNLTFTAGNIDYNAGSLGTGTTTLVGLSAANSPTSAATLTVTGANTYQLSYPVKATFNLTVTAGTTSIPIVVNANGTLVATGTIAVPEPTTVFGVALAGAGAWFARRKATRGEPRV
jgi:hypothetical protein